MTGGGYARGMVRTHQTTWKTYADYLALPEGVKAELIDGELLMSPQPKGRHVRVASFLGAQLLVRFGSSAHATSDGAGGWWILDEPEVHLKTDVRVVVPDIAGWRRERMPEPPSDSHKFLVVPDWICEILAPGTWNRDALVKMPRHLEAGVQWAWVVDPVAQRVDVFHADGREWVVAGAFEGAVKAAIPPFEAVELDLAPWWSTPA